MSRPNLVLFMPDQLRADAVGAFGSAVAKTPNIDALAARGVCFDNAFSQHSTCSQSRAAIMTGWYPHVAGHRTLTNLVKPWEPNLLRILKDSGYTVVWAGARGDTFAPGVTEQSTNFYGFSVKPQMMFSAPPFEQGHRLADAFYHGRRPVDGVALDFDEAAVQTAEQLLSDGLPEPFVLFVALVFPHPPFEVEEPWYSLHDRADMPAPVEAVMDGKPAYMRLIRGRYRTDRLSAQDWAEIAATYHGMVSRVDDHLGRVLRAVDAAGAGDRTATFVFTDHGEYLGDYGVVEKWPSSVSDCTVRNPLVAAGPGIAEGARCEAMAELVDLLPTLCDLAETAPQHRHFGRSLLPVLSDPSAPHRDEAWTEGGFSVVEEPYFERAGFPYHNKAGLQHEYPEAVGKAVAMRTTDWTYVYRLYEPDELYDRRGDPREQVNLAERPEHAALAATMRERILAWMVETADVFPFEPDPRSPRVEGYARLHVG